MKNFKKAFVWGTGVGAHNVNIQLLARGVEIIVYVDNNVKKIGTLYKGKKVFSPEELNCYWKSKSVKYLVIASQFYEAINEQAMSMGIAKEQIIYYDSSDPYGSLSGLGGITYLPAEQYRLVDGDVTIESRCFQIKGIAIDDYKSTISFVDQYPLVKQLMKSFCQAATDVADAKEEYKVGKNWGGVLRTHRKEFYEVIEKEDVAKLTELLNDFFRNSLCSSISGGKSALAAMKKNKEQKNDFKFLFDDFRVWAQKVPLEKFTSMDDLAIPHIGNPFAINVDNCLINSDCFRHHSRAYWFQNLLEGIEDPVVGEIGGGYGHFAYYWIKQNPNSTYINFDLPENLMISSYFLSMAFPEKKILYYDSSIVELTEDMFKQYDIILMPNFMVPRVADLSVDLFLNTISFSEMEYSTIADYIMQIGRTCCHYYYHKNLAHAANNYKGYPAVLFPTNEQFKLIYSGPTLWRSFSLDSSVHSYCEYLYQRK